MLMEQSEQQLDQQVDDIREMLGVLFETGDVAELRILGGGPPHGGFFTSGAKMATNAVAAECENYNVYFGLNPRRRFERDEQTMESQGVKPCNDLWCGRAASEDDILSRRWLLVDVDPIRPAGTCATDAEKAEALKVRDSAIDWLRREHGWPEPLLVDSGNGFHALYRIDLPVEDGGTVKACVYALATRFDTPYATIDTSVFDAPRICRLPRTLNRKGTSTTERPHRRARLLGGSGTQIVSRDQLMSVAKLAPAQLPIAARDLRNQDAEGPEADTEFDVVLGMHGAEQMATVLNADPTSDFVDADADLVIRRASRWAEAMPPAVSGSNGDKNTFEVACGLIVGHGLSIEEARPIFAAYNERCRPTWTDQELDRKLRYAMKEIAKNPDRVGWLLRRRDEEHKPGGKRDSMEDQLIQIIKDSTELWHTPLNKPFATVLNDDARENLPITTGAFGSWLQGAYERVHGRYPKKMQLKEAVFTACGMAIHKGPAHKIFVRIAGDEKRIYVDLGDRERRSVEIDAAGWRIVTDVPVKFRRPPGMLELPEPVSGGSIEELRPFVPLGSQEDFVLCVGFLVMAFNPNGPYPCLALSGRQGSGKSTFSRVCGELVDPCEAVLRTMPENEEDLAIAASDSAIVMVDNVSYITDRMSDALCKLATGGAYTTRAKYTPEDQTVIKYCRPLILNGIGDLATRGDLMDRSILLELRKNPRTKAEKKFWAEFRSARPRILGTLFDGVSSAIRNLPDVSDENLPRMADFTQWVLAAAPAFGWESGTFLSAYNNNIANATSTGLDLHPIVPVVRQFAEENGTWRGGWTELLGTLGARPDAMEARRQRKWPGNGSSLSQTLRRLEPSLESVGVFVDSGKEPGGNRERWVEVIFKPPTPAAQAAEQSTNTTEPEPKDDGPATE